MAWRTSSFWRMLEGKSETYGGLWERFDYDYIEPYTCLVYLTFEILSGISHETI